MQSKKERCRRKKESDAEEKIESNAEEKRDRERDAEEKREERGFRFKSPFIKTFHQEKPGHSHMIIQKQKDTFKN